MDRKLVIKISILGALAAALLAGSIYLFAKPVRYGSPQKVSALFVGNSFI
jgi:hypothetical protein